jgi:hypothetical protein
MQCCWNCTAGESSCKIKISKETFKCSYVNSFINDTQVVTDYRPTCVVCYNKLLECLKFNIEHGPYKNLGIGIIKKLDINDQSLISKLVFKLNSIFFL